MLRPEPRGEHATARVHHAFRRAAAAWPLRRARSRASKYGVSAQSSASPERSEVQSYVNAFDQGLRELGWTDGRNVRIDYQYAAGDITEMHRLTKEIVALRPDVIFASSTPITVALHQETRTIPVVFVVVSDPVGASLVASLSRPGGNITGLLNVEASMSGKWVELLNEVAPDLRRVAMMFNPDTAPGGGSYFAQAFEDAARSFKIEPISAPVHEVSDIEDVISGLGNEPHGGLVVVTDSFMSVHPDHRHLGNRPPPGAGRVSNPRLGKGRWPAVLRPIHY